MHYATHQWSDFVRGVVVGTLAADMQRHLSTGCERCNRTAATFRKLATVASLPEVAVPASVIHNAKAIFPVHSKKANGISAIVARVVFDSFLSPLPAGVRSRAYMYRQAMFEAGDVLVDVRLQNRPDGTCMLTGQVADRMAPIRSASRVVLHLVSGEQRQRLQANRFGEFETIYSSGQDIRLEISGYGRNIEVPLFEVSNKEASAELDSSIHDPINF
jgi:hypothetical protein